MITMYGVHITIWTIYIVTEFVLATATYAVVGASSRGVGLLYITSCMYVMFEFKCMHFLRN